MDTTTAERWYAVLVQFFRLKTGRSDGPLTLFPAGSAAWTGITGKWDIYFTQVGPIYCGVQIAPPNYIDNKAVKPKKKTQK